MQYIATLDAETEAAVQSRRLKYNASLPATVVINDVEVPNPDIIGTDTAYLDFVLNPVWASYRQQHVAEAPLPTPTPAPVIIKGIPQEVTMRQAQLAMERTKDASGVSLLNKVDGLIAIMGGDIGVEARITWSKSSAVKRDNSLIAALKPALQLTDAQIDDLFVLADSII
jgi:hypothetical protein